MQVGKEISVFYEMCAYCQMVCVWYECAMAAEAESRPRTPGCCHTP